LALLDTLTFMYSRRQS